MLEAKKPKSLYPTKRILNKIRSKFSFHYVAYTILFVVVSFSIINIVTATTPNPGHPWLEIGDGAFQVTYNQTATRTYTFPDASTTILTTNDLVTVGQGGTGVGSFTSNGVLYGNGTSALQVTVAGTTGQCLIGTTGSAPSWGSCTGSGISWSALVNPTGDQTLTFDAGEENIWTVGATTADFWTMTANSLTTGSLVSLIGTQANNNGSGLLESFATILSENDTGTNLYIETINQNTTDPNTAFGVESVLTDATNINNEVYGMSSLVTISGSGNKSAYGLSSAVNSSGTGTEDFYGVQGSVVSSGVRTTGTSHIFGVHGDASTESSDGATINVYGIYARASGTVTSGVINAYGIYVPNGASSTTGTSTKYGLYVEDQTGADANYSAIFAGGNVGIGDTTPDDLLNIHSATASAGLAITSLGTDTDPYIKFELADGTTSYIMGVDDSNNDRFIIARTAFGTNDDFSIDGSGNVGIGTSGPATLLDVRGASPIITVGTASNTEGALYFGNSGHGIMRNYNGTANDVGFYTTSSALYLSTSGNTTTNQFKLNSSGEVQIGSASDIGSYALQITGNTIVDSGTLTVPGAGTNSERFGAGTTAAGNNTVVVGNGASAPYTDSVAIGYLATLTNAAGNGLSTAIGRSASAGYGGVAIGYGATTTGDENVAIGIGATATAAYQSVALGRNAAANSASGGSTALGDSAAAGTNSVSVGNGSAGSGYSVAIGSSANTGTVGSNLFNIAIGQGASASTFSPTIVLGSADAIATANNQLVIGSPAYPMATAYLGGGVVRTSPSNIVINATGGSGTDIAGSNLSFAGGKATGNAAGGYISFQTSDVLGSGTTLQSLTEKARFNTAGELQIGSTSDLGAYKLQVTGDSILDGGLIVNEGGANKDFRVESDTITSAIAVAGSTGNVTIGTLDTDLTAPTTSGTTRCVITDANGQLSFTTCGGGGGAWSDITNPTGDLALTFDAGEETLFTTNATTATAFSIASSTLSSGTLLDLTVTGTSALDNQKGLNISLSGVNGTASQTTYGAYASNAHTGTSATNFGGYFSATGASNSYNIGLYSEASGATGNNSYSGYFVGDNFVVGDSFLGNNYLNIEIVSGLFEIGDIDGVSNGTHLSIDDTAEEFNFSQNGNVTIGGASSTYKLNVLSSLTGQTVNKRVADFSNTGSTFDTTSGNLTSYGGYFSSTSTESAGGNVLTNVALYATASGADANYAAIFENGNVGIGDTTPSALFTVGSGDLFQVNSTGAIAAATGITSSGTITFSGLGGAGTKCLQTDNSGVVTAAASACGSGGGLTVGTTAITSGGTNRVLYENGSNILSESADFTYDGTTLGVATSSTTASNKALNIAQTGGTTGTDYAGYFSNTGAATTNVGGYFTASGGTNNYAGVFENGRVLIGTASDVTSIANLFMTRTLTTETGSTGAGVAGIHQNFTFNPTSGTPTQVGNRLVVSNTGTVATTAIGQIIRMDDTPSSGTPANLIRGLEIVASVGSNTAGTNTGIRSTGKTFGVQAITTGAAGGVALPAGLYAENTGTTQGDVARFYTGSMTSAASMLNVYHDTSTFTGDALIMDMAVGSGTFSGDFLDLRNASDSKFKVDSTGQVTLTLDGTASTSAVCGSHAGGTTGDQTDIILRDCSGAPAADYAEMYPMETGMEFGDIVATGSEVVNTYDTTDGNIDWTKVKGKITRMIKTTQSYQPNVIGIVVDNYGDFTSAGHNIKEVDNPMPVALNGRVPVKVASDSGSIMPGDYITTSGSEPGKAQKAKKSGQVIGKALETWEPNSGALTVMVYVEQGYYNGTSVSEFAGIDPMASDFAKQVLSHFMNNQSTQAGSELILDRLAVGVEIITPKVVANELEVNTISTSTSGDIGLVLGSDGKFIVSSGDTQNTNPAITFDALGNATFAGKVTAGEIEVSNLAGIQSITDQINQLSEGQVAFTLTSQVINTLSSALTIAQADISKLNQDLEALESSVTGLVASGDDLESRINLVETFFATDESGNPTGIVTVGLSVNGNGKFTGQTEFDGLSFFSNTTSFTGGVTFAGQTEFVVPPLYNKDSAGYALIKQGDRRAQITFDQPYIATPVVNTSVTFEEEDLDDTETATFFADDIRFIVMGKNQDGFTIVLNKPATRDIRFSWNALSVKDPNIFESVFEGLTIEQTPEPEPEPTPETPEGDEAPPDDSGDEPQETPTPEPEPEPSPTPDEPTPDTSSQPSPTQES